MSERSFSSANSRRHSRKESSAAQQKPTKKKSLSSLLSTALSQSRKVSGMVKKISSSMQRQQTMGDYYVSPASEAIDLMFLHGTMVEKMSDLVLILKEWERMQPSRKRDLNALIALRKKVGLAKVQPLADARYLTQEEARMELGLSKAEFYQETSEAEKPWEEEG